MIDMAHTSSHQHAGWLRIWQQNANKSRTAHNNLLQSLKAAAYDICTIQELALNSFNNMTANAKWRVVYPKTHSRYPRKTRSVIFVSAAISTNLWHSLDTNLGDLTATSGKKSISLLTFTLILTYMTFSDLANVSHKALYSQEKDNN